MNDWDKVLSEVNDDENLSKDNVIEKIKNALKEHLRKEYDLWEKESFDINYDFYFRHYRRDKVDGSFYRTTILDYASYHNEADKY